MRFKGPIKTDQNYEKIIFGQCPLAQNYYLRKITLNYFWQITTFTRNSLKMFIFPGDFEVANFLKNTKMLRELFS